MGCENVHADRFLLLEENLVQKTVTFYFRILELYNELS